VERQRQRLALESGSEKFLAAEGGIAVQKMVSVPDVIAEDALRGRAETEFLAAPDRPAAFVTDRNAEFATIMSLSIRTVEMY